MNTKPMMPKTHGARGIAAVERLSFDHVSQSGQGPDKLAAGRHGNAPGKDAAGPDFRSQTPARRPPATQTTGEANQDPTIKKMNEDEKQKVDTKGK